MNVNNRFGGSCGTATYRTDLDVLDLRENPLPFYDLPTPPAMAHRRYTMGGERSVGERLDAADGFIVLTNEFNHGYSAALKNVLDHFFAELLHKPMAFVGYGNVGGSRAIEQLRLVAAELGMVSVREAVHILGTHMAEIRNAPDRASEVLAALDGRLDTAVDALTWWADALRVARAADHPEVAA
jgi:NAD(P)H-dependent FMN reductase